MAQLLLFKESMVEEKLGIILKNLGQRVEKGETLPRRISYSTPLAQLALSLREKNKDLKEVMTLVEVNV